MNLAAGPSRPVPRAWAEGAIADGRRREKGRAPLPASPARPSRRPRPRPGRAREPLGRPGIRGNQARAARAARRGRAPFAPLPAQHGLARV